ncbi:hypothetical protein IAT40_005763 [Kwoniella sp. CBS 6097]
MLDYVETPCDYPGCHTSVVLSWAACWMCGQVRCQHHDTSELHDCAGLANYEARRERQETTTRRYLEDILTRLRVCHDDIINDCSSLRPGHTCNLTIPETGDNVTQAKILGTFNVNFPLTFDDGVRWMVRVRQDEGHRAPFAVRDPDIRTEVATLNWLKASGMAVPAAWLPSHMVRGLSEGPEPPLDFFYNELVDGSPWKIKKRLSSAIDFPEKELRRFIEAYAQTQIQLSKLEVPVDMIGSHIDAALEFNSLGAFSPKYRVASHLWHLELRELGDHILADDKHEVTGIIDWQWAYATTKEEAFAAADIFYVDLDYVFDGDNSLRRDEKTLIEIYEREGKTDLADCVRNGRLYNRLSRIGQYDVIYDKAAFREVLGPMPAGFNPPRDDEAWKEYMMERYKDHEGLKRVIERFGLDKE